MYTGKRKICGRDLAARASSNVGWKRARCRPSEEKLTGAEVVREQVVLDQNAITSRGMGTAIPFSLKLVEVLCGMERAEEVRKSIIYNEE